jgi:hypothetical protein
VQHWMVQHWMVQGWKQRHLRRDGSRWDSFKGGDTDNTPR